MKMETVVLDDIIEIISGGTPKTSNADYWGGDIPWLSVKDFNNDNRYVYETEKSITEAGLNHSAATLLQRDDIVLSARGTVGAITMVPFPMTFNQSCYGLRAKEGIDQTYLYYCVKNAVEKLKHITHGSVFDTITRDTFKNVEVVVHSYQEQKRIAHILVNLDDKIAINNQVNQNLSEQIESLLLAFIDGEDTTPVKLGDYLYIKGRIGWKGLKKSEYLDQSEYRIINGETLTKSGIDWSKAGYISKERYDESPEIMLNTGDVLLSKDGTIGKIGYVDSLELPTSVASGIFVIRNNKPDIISTTFIYYLLKSRLFEAFIVARTEGSVIPHLYQKDFMEFEFPLPNQKRMAQFEEIAEPMFSQIINNLNENKRLATLRDALLPKLMSGELDVSEIDL